MEDRGMYGRHARLYDLIYHFKDYGVEARGLRQLLCEEGVCDGSRLLELACGTGSFLEHFARWYRVAGLDLSEAFVEIARDKVPLAQVSHADMRSFEVSEPVDAVLCLFSSIAYLREPEDLAAALSCAAEALRPGGVLLVEPFVSPEDWKEGTPFIHTYESEDLKLCRAAVSHAEGHTAILDFHWLVVPRGGPVEHLQERHLLRLWRRAELVEAAHLAGFTARFEEGGRGLLVGRRGPA